MRIRCFFVLASLSAAQALAQVELPPGFEIVDFHVSDDYTQRPSLNNCGQIAYGKRFGSSWAQSEIFLYENGRITRITENGDRDVFPQINDGGTMVWMRGMGDSGAHQVLWHSNGAEVVLEDDRWGLSLVALNNSGHAVWTRVRSGCPRRSEVRMFNGFDIAIINESRLMNQGPDINDSGWITWMHTDFCESNPWAGTIQLYRNGEVFDLPSSQTQVQGPQINNSGQVVWDANGDLEMWRDGRTEVLLKGHVAVPNIGDSGVIYFARWDVELRRWSAWAYWPAEDDEPRFYRLSDDAFWVARGAVNAWGEIAWVYYRDELNGDWGGGIRYLRRIRTGDVDFDGDVGLFDWSRFAGAMTGPVWTDGLCELRFLDLDDDGDLDLSDCARMQNAFGL